MKRAVFLDRDGVINASVVRDGKPYPPASADEIGRGMRANRDSSSQPDAINPTAAIDQATATPAQPVRRRASHVPSRA